MLRTIIKRQTLCQKAFLPKFDVERTEINGVRHYVIQPDNLKGLSEAGQPKTVVTYPSVTTLLKPMNAAGIQAWRDRVGTREANRKQVQGSRRGDNLHKLCERYLLDGQVDVTSEFPTIRKLFKQVQPVIDENVNVIFGVELPLFSHELQTAGTADLVCAWNNVFTIGDFKTSSKKKDRKYMKHYIYQTVAYGIMLEEMYGYRPEQLALIFGLEESEKADIVLESIDRYIPEVKEYFRTVERPSNHEEFSDLPPWD